MTAAAALGSRQAAILAHLGEHPGLTATELAREFGLHASLYKQLARLQQKALVAGVPVWNPAQGRQVTRWHVAPPGTVPPPCPAPDPDAVRRRRERDTAAQRARRARRSPPRLVGAAVLPDLAAAACKGADTDLFFPPDWYEDPPARRRREGQARAFCDRCPVRRRCFDLADARGERHGIYGGVDFGDRRKKAKAS